MNEPGINRIVLPGQTAPDGPAVPDWFRERLRQYDSSLLVSWSRLKRRFVIEQCVRHYPDPAGNHTFTCGRVYVLLAQDPEGAMMPLGERVLEMIRERDVEKAGYGPHDLTRFLKDQHLIGEKAAAESEKAQQDVIRYGARHNRRQLLKAVHLIQQHNMTPNK